MSVDEICKHIGADSLAFVSLDGLYRALGEEKRDDHAPQFEDACFTGFYPVPLTDHDNNRTGTQVSRLQEREAKKA